jgi:hypothetical protein
MDIYISHYYCNTTIYLRRVYLNYIYLNYGYFHFCKNESQLRPCDQLSKYVGPLGTVLTQTAKGRGQLFIYRKKSILNPEFVEVR